MKTNTNKSFALSAIALIANPRLRAHLSSKAVLPVVVGSARRFLAAGRSPSTQEDEVTRFSSYIYCVAMGL